MLKYSLLLWPGFARAWYRGEIYSACVAVLFAACAHILWAAHVHWPLWLPAGPRRCLLAALAIASVYSLFQGLRQRQGIFGAAESAVLPKTADAAFQAAQRAYLRGEYYEAEAALHAIFVAGHEDVEAALLLVGILRRTGRVSQAVDTLDRLCKLDAAARWTHEIRGERLRCVQATHHGQTEAAAAA